MWSAGSGQVNFLCGGHFELCKGEFLLQARHVYSNKKIITMSCNETAKRGFPFMMNPVGCDQVPSLRVYSLS